VSSIGVLRSALWNNDLKTLNTYHRDGIVDLGVGEEVGPQCLLLDLPRQHFSHLVGLVEQVPNLQEVVMLVRFFAFLHYTKKFLENKSGCRLFSLPRTEKFSQDSKLQDINIIS